MGNNRIPEFESKNQFEVTQGGKNDAGAQAMLAAFSKFSQTAATIGSSLLKQEAKDDRLTLQYNIANAYDGFAQSSMKIQDPIKALEDYKKKSTAYAQSLSVQSNATNKGFVDNLTSYYGNHNLHALQTNATNYTLRSEKDASIKGLNTLWNSILSEIHTSQPNYIEGKTDAKGKKTFDNTQFENSHALFSSYVSGINSLIKKGMMKPEGGNKAIRGQTKAYRAEIITKSYSDALQVGNGKQVIKELMNENIEGYSAADKTALIVSLGKVNNAFLKSMGLSAEGLHSKMKQQLDAMKRDGGAQNQQLNDDVRLAFPNRYENFQQQQKIAHDVYQVGQYAESLSPQQQDDALEKIRPKDPTAPDFAEKSAIYHDIATQIQNQRSVYEKDPVASELKNQQVVDEFKNWQIAQQTGQDPDHKPGSPINQTMNNPYKTLMDRAKLKGIQNPPVLTNSDAVTQVNLVQSLTPNEKIAYFSKWQTRFNNDEVYDSFVKQLVKNGLPAEQEGFLATFPATSPDAKYIAEALSIPTKDLDDQISSKDTNKIYKNQFKSLVGTAVYDSESLGKVSFESVGFNTDANDWKLYMRAQSSYAGGNSSQALGKLDSLMGNLAKYYWLNGVDQSPDAAVTHAQKNIAGRYNVTTIGKTDTLIPTQYNADVVRSYALREKREVKNFPFVRTTMTQGGALTPVQAEEQDHQNILGGHWVLATNNQGLVWVDSMGKLRTDKNGNPMNIQFTDAQNNHEKSPDIHSLMDDLEATHSMGSHDSLMNIINRDVPGNVLSSLIGKMFDTVLTPAYKKTKNTDLSKIRSEDK